LDYDPIKDRLGGLFTRSPLAHRLFFRGLDAVFLRAWYVHRALRQILRQLPNRELRVLDAGTGFGQYAYWLLRQDPRVRISAVDVKTDYLETAGRFFEAVGLDRRIELREHDLTEPLPERGAFDLALSVDVMEHIEDDRSVFANVAGALRPGGFFVVNTPSDKGGSDADTEGESFIGEHVREGYAPADLAEKLETAGLEVVEWTYTYGRYGSAAWKLLIKHPIRLLNRSWAFAPLLAPYYAVAGPAGIALNALDVRATKPEGTGLLMVARKPTGTALA
jgi:2-polyprenyl-3-methyl-5-hydroxy-6-metoxy-1,4-benzoquinol methylase